jgi:hypothetical protein
MAVPDTFLVLKSLYGDAAPRDPQLQTQRSPFPACSSIVNLDREWESEWESAGL